MRPLLTGVGAFLLLVALGVSPAARGSVRETFARDLPLVSGGRLTVDTSRGDIRVSSWNRDSVELRAERTAERPEDLDLVPIDVQSRPDELTIASRVPVYAGRVHVRVNYRLRVPSRVDLKGLTTTTGDIVVSGVIGRAVARVENGDITITGTSGLLDVMTTTGRINASPATVADDASLRLETYNGDIRLVIPPATAGVRFELRTLNGTIHSDIPFDISRNFGPQWVHAVASPRGPLVCAYTANGDIDVRAK